MASVIGRENEIEKLNRLLHSGRPEFLALYGRRRVGKTFLVRQHLNKEIVFDISGIKDGSKEQQLYIFYSEYLKRTRQRKKSAPPQTWLEAFHMLAEYVQRLPKTKTKHVVFIDEMPWLDTPKSQFISALEFFWNQHA